MAKCKYFADNGKPSQLFDRLYSYYTDRGMPAKQAEQSALTSWLSTRSETFRMFAGEWQHKNPAEQVDEEGEGRVPALPSNATVTLDSNGEPEMVYIGESSFFDSLPVEDYSSLYAGPNMFTFTPHESSDASFKHPFFLSIKNPKVVNIDADFSKDQMYAATREIDKTDYDGVVFIHTKENGDKEKLYGLFDTSKAASVYNSREGEPNTKYDKGDEAAQLESIKMQRGQKDSVNNLMTQASTSTQLLEGIMREGTHELAKLSRSILLASNKSILLKEGAKNLIAYDRESGGLFVDRNMQLSRDTFNNTVLSEIVRGYTLESLGTEKMAGLDNIVNTMKTRYADSVYSRYFNSTADFVNGFLDNPAFMEYLKDTTFPAENTSVFNSVMKQLGDLFGLRQTYIPFLEKSLKLAMYNREEQSIRLYSTPLVMEIEAENEAAEEGSTPDPNKPKGFNPSAPYAHLITGDKLLDKHIANINDKIHSLRRQTNVRAKPLDNAKITADRLRYEEDLKKLVQEQSLNMLVQVGKMQMLKFEQTLKAGLSHNEAWSSLNLLKGWSQLLDNVKTEIKSKQMQEDIENITLDGIRLHKKYLVVAQTSTMDLIRNEGLSDDYIQSLIDTDVVPDIGTLSGDFTGLGFGTQGAEVINNYLIANRAAETNNEVNSFLLNRDKLLKKLGGKDISYIFRKDENDRYRPICAFKDELYEKMGELDRSAYDSIRALQPLSDERRQLSGNLRKAKKAGDKNQMAMIAGQIRELDKRIKDEQSKRTTFDTKNEFMRKNFDYEITQQGLDEFNQFAEALRESFYEVTIDNKLIFNKEKYNRALEKHDPKLLMEWIKDPTKTYPIHAARFAAITPKAQWKNPAYDAFSPAQKEFYDFFVAEYLKAHSHVPMDYSFTEYNSDLLLREFAYMDKKVADKFKYLKNNVTDFFKDIVSVEYTENDVSFDVKGPLSGKMVKKVKWKGVKKFARGTDGYFKEGQTLPASVEEAVKLKRFKWKDGYLVHALPGKKFETMVKNFVAIEDDPLEIFTNFVKFGYNYKYKREVEDVLNSVVEMSAAIPKQASAFKNKVNSLGIPFGTQDKSEIDARLQYTTDAYLHEQFKDPLVTAGTGVPGERTYSGKQFVEKVNNYTRARHLGLNIASGVTNLTIGTMNNFIYAGRDEFFNEKELRHAYWLLKDSIASLYNGGTGKIGNAQKIMLLMQQFNMLGNLHEKMQDDKEWVNKLFEHLFMFQKGGEYLNQGAVVLAMMLRDKTVIDGKEVSLWDSFEVKDDQLVFKYPGTKYADKKTLFIFGQAAKKVNKEIHSDYDVLTPMKAKRQLRWRVAGLFRTWLPVAIKSRLGGNYKDAELSMYKGYDVYREGRWNTFARIMGLVKNKTADGKPGPKVNRFKNLVTFMGAILATTISNNYGRKVMNSLEMNAIDKANMNANVKEAWWLMTVAVASMMMSKIKMDDDDDKDGENAINISYLRYIYNMTSRVENELYFFYNPWSASTILRDAIPLWSTLEQAFKVGEAAKNFAFNNEMDTYQRGFRKGKSKFGVQLQLFFPVMKQYQSAWSMWSQIYSDKYH